MNMKIIKNKRNENINNDKKKNELKKNEWERKTMWKYEEIWRQWQANMEYR